MSEWVNQCAAAVPVELVVHRRDVLHAGGEARHALPSRSALPDDQFCGVKCRFVERDGTHPIIDDEIRLRPVICVRN